MLLERPGVDASPEAMAGDPVLSGALVARTRRVLTSALLVLLIAVPSLLLASWGVTGPKERALLAGLTGVVLVFWLLVRAGRVRAALYGVVFGFIAYAVGQLAAYGSIRGIGVMAFVGAIVLGGFFLGRAVLALAVTISLASIAFLIHAENAGWLPSPNLAVGLRHWIVYAVIFVALAVIVYVARSLLEEATRELSHELGKRRRVEEELGHAEDIFRVMFRENPAALIITTLDGTIVDINAEYERVFRIDRARAIGANSAVLGLWRSAAQRAAFIDDLLRSGRIASRRIGFRRADGEEFEAVVTTESLLWRGSTHCFSTITDVSEEARLRDALEASRRRFSQAFRLSPIGMTITRLSDGTILEVNDADERTLGLRREVAVGRSSLETGAWTDRQARQTFVDELLRDGRVLGYETRMRRRDGSEFDARIFAERIELDGEDCILAAILNVSEQKRHESEIRDLNRSLEARVRSRTRQLEEANAELEAFSYSVSHDLRSPLRAVEGFTSLLAEDLGDKLDAEARGLIERVVTNCTRMNRLIDDLLGLSRVGRFDLVRSANDLSAMAREIVDKLRHAQPGRVVEVEIEPGVIAECDRELARIVLDNLIGNAWKFTGRSPDARIRFGRESGQDAATVYFVADNGAGFDMAYASKLFTPFQRLHGRDEFEGTGIGLATIRRIIARHEGRVWAEGAPGSGAIFRFTLERG
ncbi:MAG: PAS domain S-box protein [Burkholderiales bacterium]|nr:PAS domain S-box protein [Burkholderiales bacterium]